MNIEQIKKDMDNGVMISKSTVVKLVQAARGMEMTLGLIAENLADSKNAADCIEHVESL